MIDILKAIPVWMLLFVVRTIVIVIGLPVVAVALNFAHEDTSSPRQQFTQYPGEWRFIRLPWWAWLWDNPSDGAMGDKRGWYWVVGHPRWMKSDFLKCWYWLACRNPANMFSRYTRGVAAYMPDIVKIDLLAGDEFVRDREGGEGWQFVRAIGKRFTYWNFYFVKQWFNSKKAFVIRLGHKIEPRHDGRDWSQDPEYKRWKGMTFRLTPFKDIS